MTRTAQSLKPLSWSILAALCVVASPLAFAAEPDLISRDDDAELAQAVQAAPSVAQTTTPATTQTPGPAAGAVTLETVVVTARKREEELQQTPQAITAFTAETIKREGITSIADVAQLTTGLNFAPIFGQVVATPIIRGSAQTFGAPNVGVFLDGVYLTGKSAIDIDLADLDRIEVVKGPQSALYGRNTFAGAINYITKQPSFDPRGDFLLSGGSFGLREGRASYSGPINDAMAFRVAGSYRKHDGYFNSSLDEGEIDFEEISSFSAEMLAMPSDRLSVRARLSYTDEDSGQPASAVVRANALPRARAIIPPTTGLGLNQTFVGQLPDRQRSLSVNTTRLNEFNDYGYLEDTTRFSLTADYSFDAMSLISITSWNKRNSEYQFDGDNTVCDRAACPNFGPPIAGGFSRLATSSQIGSDTDFSQELRLQSTGEGPLSWLAGMYYYRTDSDAIQRSLSPVNSQATFGFPRIELQNRSTALFAQVSYDFNEQWGLTVEGRGERETQGFQQAPTVTVGIPPTSSSLVVFDLAQDFTFFTPRITLDYKPNDAALYYANVGKGVKTGGFNTNLRIFDNQRIYGEESQISYELGAKLSWLEDRLRTNVAMYRTTWDDQQVACQNPVNLFPGATTTQRTYVCNVGEAQIKGLEFDAQYAINEYATFQAGYSYTDARYKTFVDDSLAATLANADLPLINFNGRFLPYVPRNVFFYALNLDVPMGDDVAFFGSLTSNRATRQFLRADNLAFIRGRTVWNMRAGVRAGPWSFTGFVDNLTDDDAAVTGVRFFDAVNFSVPAPLVTWSNPRQVGVIVEYAFR